MKGKRFKIILLFFDILVIMVISGRRVIKKSISVAEAKATFSECIRKVESGLPVLITRHGKSVAALVSPDDLEHLERLRKAGPEGGLAAGRRFLDR